MRSPVVGLAMGMGSMLGPETFEGTIEIRLSDILKLNDQEEEGTRNKAI